MNDKNKEYRSPRRDDKGDYHVTPAMLAETYDERLLEEMKETLAATVMAESMPEKLDYKPFDRKYYDEEEQI